MIPFDRLGPVFKAFSSLVYPRVFRTLFASSLQEVPRAGSVLDVGSGTGILSQFACKVRRDLLFTMIDPAAGMLRFAPDFARRVLGRAEDLPFPERAFDAVFAGDSMHHFSDPRRAVGELRRVLRKGGVLVVFEIDPSSLIGAMITGGEKIFREPAHFLKPGELAERLAEVGFECVVSRYDWRYAIIAHAGRG
ncbi:MAG: putative methyltransferase YcgJ [Syntrophorhabdus sp. PtaB.Bin047]|jgi:demethylmenaquinone methyltransferase/2-methoxy-6-polyprenyl-1,4-benzoquinol methylase|nr:MAG: putative methyltransferase YcgJ [Syntrophorhabdus sp. PtaB.Bin047]